MNWPDIAAVFRKVWNVQGERVGHLDGTWKDPAGNERHGFTANSERGGTKLTIIVEIEDFEALDPAVADQVKKGIENVFLVGRMVAMKQTLDTIPLNRAKLETSTKELAERAVQLRRGTLR